MTELVERREKLLQLIWIINLNPSVATSVEMAFPVRA